MPRDDRNTRVRPAPSSDFPAAPRCLAATCGVGGQLRPAGGWGGHGYPADALPGLHRRRGFHGQRGGGRCPDRRFLRDGAHRRAVIRRAGRPPGLARFAPAGAAPRRGRARPDRRDNGARDPAVHTVTGGVERGGGGPGDPRVAGRGHRRRRGAARGCGSRSDAGPSWRSPRSTSSRSASSCPFASCARLAARAIAAVPAPGGRRWP